jgi:hypothetical protein
MVIFGRHRPRGVALHYDGEFADEVELSVATLTGRNFGWLPVEREVAFRHIARVVREDEGIDPRRVTDVHGRGIPYRVILRGLDKTIPDALKLPHRYRIDVLAASDQEVVETVAALLTAYMDALRFGTAATFRDAVSPYDVFLSKNGFPETPARGEAAQNYARRLLSLVQSRKNFVWVSSADGRFLLHDQTYEFGPEELRGLRIFLSQGGGAHGRQGGNCLQCHPPPAFTDYKFRNNGASQAEYDEIFGPGAFAALEIPGLAERRRARGTYLPTTAANPNSQERFRAAPARERPGWVDLGLWNVFANSDFPRVQARLQSELCEELTPHASQCEAAELLPFTIARFKTPSLRDLGQSDPYMHSGALKRIEDVVRYYIGVGGSSRLGTIRNGDEKLRHIYVEPEDVAPLSAFLRALNEDYR